MSRDFNSNRFNSVSVCMPVYNGSKYIELQILSILESCNSWGGNWELLICDDFSSDNTLQVVTSFSAVEPRIRILSNNKNLGVVRTVNRLLCSATKDVIILSDQDDVWHRNRVNCTVSAFREERCSVVLCCNQLINSDSQILDKSYPPKIFGKTRTNLLASFIRNQYLGCCMALDRNILDKVLPIPQFSSMHDIWIGIIASLSSGVFYDDRTLVYYRRHSSNVTSLTTRSLAHAFYHRVTYIAMIFAALIRLYRVP